MFFTSNYDCVNMPWVESIENRHPCREFSRMPNVYMYSRCFAFEWHSRFNGVNVCMRLRVYTTYYTFELLMAARQFSTVKLEYHARIPVQVQPMRYTPWKRLKTRPIHPSKSIESMWMRARVWVSARVLYNWIWHKCHANWRKMLFNSMLYESLCVYNEF